MLLDEEIFGFLYLPQTQYVMCLHEVIGQCTKLQEIFG
jgi:hypothetical protein